MKQYRVEATGLEGRFGRLRVGQLIEQHSLEQAGHNPDELVRAGRLVQVEDSPAVLPVPDAGVSATREAELSLQVESLRAIASELRDSLESTTDRMSELVVSNADLTAANAELKTANAELLARLEAGEGTGGDLVLTGDDAAGEAVRLTTAAAEHVAEGGAPLLNVPPAATSAIAAAAPPASGGKKRT